MYEIGLIGLNWTKQKGCEIGLIVVLASFVRNIIQKFVAVVTTKRAFLTKVYPGVLSHVTVTTALLGKQKANLFMCPRFV